MGLIPVLLQAYQSWNGGKTWTGTVVILATYGIQHYLPSLGMDKDAATIAVTSIVQGIGYIILIWGAIHKIIKSTMAKKDGKRPSDGTCVLPLLLFALLLFAAPHVQATEKIDAPFKYFLSKIHVTMDTVMWAAQPTVAIPTVLAYQSSDKGRILDVSAFDRAAAGVSYGRYVKSTTGETYETIGVSVLAMFSTEKDFSAGLTLDLFNRLIGIGPGFDFGNRPDGHRAFLMMNFGIKVF